MPQPRKNSKLVPVSLIVALSEGHRDGGGAMTLEHTILREGKWKHPKAPGGELNIDKAMLGELQKNFAAGVGLAKDSIPFHVGHTEAQDDRAAAWAQVKVVPDEDRPGKQKMVALAHYTTPQDYEKVSTGQYAFVSPTIDYGFTDRESGAQHKAVLRNVALTNYPFIKQMGPARVVNLSELAMGEGDAETVALAFGYDGGGGDNGSPNMAGLPSGMDASALPNECRVCARLGNDCPFAAKDAASDLALKTAAAQSGNCPQYVEADGQTPGAGGAADAANTSPVIGRGAQPAAGKGRVPMSEGGAMGEGGAAGKPAMGQGPAPELFQRAMSGKKTPMPDKSKRPMTTPPAALSLDGPSGTAPDGSPASGAPSQMHMMAVLAHLGSGPKSMPEISSIAPPGQQAQVQAATHLLAASGQVSVAPGPNGTVATLTPKGQQALSGSQPSGGDGDADNNGGPSDGDADDQGGAEGSDPRMRDPNSMPPMPQGAPPTQSAPPPPTPKTTAQMSEKPTSYKPNTALITQKGTDAMTTDQKKRLEQLEQQMQLAQAEKQETFMVALAETHKIPAHTLKAIKLAFEVGTGNAVALSALVDGQSVALSENEVDFDAPPSASAIASVELSDSVVISRQYLRDLLTAAVSGERIALSEKDTRLVEGRPALTTTTALSEYANLSPEETVAKVKADTAAGRI